MSTSTPLAAGFTSGVGSGCWKKPRLETFWYERISRSRLNRSPGSITIASRITRSWVTSLPTISTLLIVAGEPSRMVQREIDDRLAVAAGAADLLRLHLGVDVAVVGVEVLDLLGGRVPLRAAERRGAAHRACRSGPTGPNG